METTFQAIEGGLESFKLSVRTLDGELVRVVSAYCRDVRRLSIATDTIPAPCKPIWEALGVI